MSDLQQKTRTPGRIGARALAVAATVAAAVLVWLVGEPLLGNDLVIPLLLRTPRTGDAP